MCYYTAHYERLGVHESTKNHREGVQGRRGGRGASEPADGGAAGVR